MGSGDDGLGLFCQCLQEALNEEALRAVEIGDKRALQNIAPEIRSTAEEFYDGIERG